MSEPYLTIVPPDEVQSLAAAITGELMLSFDSLSDSHESDVVYRVVSDAIVAELSKPVIKFTTQNK